MLIMIEKIFQKKMIFNIWYSILYFNSIINFINIKNLFHYQKKSVLYHFYQNTFWKNLIIKKSDLAFKKKQFQKDFNFFRISLYFKNSYLWI